VTAEIGASTMAVYTHFGGMPGLFDALVREGLGRFAEHVRQVPDTDDPMADLISGGLAYGAFAFQNPELYQLIFGLSSSATPRGANVNAGTAWRLPEGAAAFSVLLRAVERVIESGHFRPQPAMTAATQILGVTHGYVLLVIGGFVTEEAEQLIAPLTVNLMVGLGADRRAAERSLVRATAARA
jgi:AcrR family transcriptional regulator